jgi:putative two-component system response regulator
LNNTVEKVMELNDKSSFSNAYILVVDDERMITEMLHEAIQNAGYDCSVAGSGEEALKILKKKEIDIVITDIEMPGGLSGIDLLSRIKEEYSSDVIVITGYTDNFNFEQIMEKGASDFLQKPFSIRDFMIRMQRVLKERTLVAERNQAYETLNSANKQLLRYGQDLNQTILDLKVTHEKLKGSYLDTIHRLVLAAEYKDEDTGDHIIRMGRYSAYLAEKLGFPDKEVQNILYAAPMHDVGKIGIPDSILMKPGKLTKEEFEIIKTHTLIGGKLLKNSKSDILQLAEQIALSHHEKWNGTGYPKGLAGEEIPMIGRIVSIADVFDALTSKRPYKEPFSVEKAVDIIKKESGQHFDPEVARVFLESIDGVLKIKQETDPTKKMIFPEISS